MKICVFKKLYKLRLRDAATQMHNIKLKKLASIKRVDSHCLDVQRITLKNKNIKLNLKQ